MDLGLKGKRALVTGGSRGIGLAIYEILARDSVIVSTCARGQENHLIMHLQRLQQQEHQVTVRRLMSVMMQH